MATIQTSLILVLISLGIILTNSSHISGNGTEMNFSWIDQKKFDSINQFWDNIMQNSLYGEWEILRKDIKHFTNNKGFVKLSVDRYNVSSDVRLNDFVKFTIRLLDGKGRNKWLEMKNFGLVHHNVSYDFENNLFDFRFNTTGLDLGQLFEMNHYKLESGLHYPYYRFNNKNGVFTFKSDKHHRVFKQ